MTFCNMFSSLYLKELSKYELFKTANIASVWESNLGRSKSADFSSKKMEHQGISESGNFFKIKFQSFYDQ